MSQFRILGPIEVDVAEDLSDRVPRGRTLSLLALLLVHRGTVVPVDRAVDELWDGAGPRHAKKAVQVLASRLRSALGEGVVLSEGGGYALRPAAGSVDAERFEELSVRGRAELARGEPLEAAATLRQALALWRGPALADVSHERFAQPEIARLEDLRLACLGDRLDADLAGGRHAEVAGELEGLVRQHPLRERLRALQMLALYLMSDLTWLMGDPVTSYADAERMLGHARLAGSGFDVGTALIFHAWGLVEGPWPTSEAIARCDALTGEAAGQRGAELNLRGCRAVLTAMGGDHERARHDMAEARAGLAELHLGVISAYLALLDAIAEMLAGDPASAERAVRDAEAIILGSGTHWYLSLISADLALAILAQHRLADAAEAVARIETLPAPCDTEWVIKRHMARALLAAEAGEHERGLEDARRAVAVADATSLILCRAGAHRTLAELLRATDRTDAAADHAQRALRLDEAKGNSAAATATRQRFSRLLDPHPGVQTQEGVKSPSYTDD